MSEEVVTAEAAYSQVIARPVISADEAVEAAQQLRELIARVLVMDKHYMQIRGRDVLLKAGAEELAKFFGLGCEYHELATELKDGVFMASVKCSVSNSSGRILAESYGFYDSTERKNSNPNTVVKMAQKRAYVGAVMAATGTSELFTQDLEDNDKTGAPAVPEGHLVLEDYPASKEDVEAFLRFFQAKRGDETNEYVVGWLKENQVKTAKGGAVSRWWLGARALGLLKMPDAGPHAKEPPAAQPELPSDPMPLPDPTVEDVVGEVVSDDDIPF